LSYDYQEIETNMKFVKGEEKFARTAHHFAFTFDNRKFYDSYGLIDLEEYDYNLVIHPSLTESFYQAVMEHGRWNTRFNAYEELSKIEKQFKIKL
jgi:hypothetical protein